MTSIFCKYCHHHWKIKREYENHIGCCEYFYKMRRTTPNEVDEHGTKIPSMRELFRYVQELSAKLERTEKEVQRLKTTMHIRQKKAILDWLKQPKNVPAVDVEDWWKRIEVNETHILHVGERDLTDGMKMCIKDFLETCSGESFPIRTFTQKPNMFYVYTRGLGVFPEWKIMSNEQFDSMLLHLSQLFLREFLKWQKSPHNTKEYKDDRDTDKEIQFMIKINGMRTPSEKRVLEMKKWLFPRLEENLRLIMECDFE
jgi:hypothetical protein